MVGGAAAVGGAIGGLGGHFLEGLSRGDAKELGDALSEGEAGLVVIGESRAEDLDGALTRAQRSIEKELDADPERLKRGLADAEKQLAQP